ncbi:hypothetical protein NZD89_06500 [Alicyclobacillus fastidiosus]|uniref:Uncharacterized protein n=1 Tax=Alicyclobacillus fastidiosus TaxID=392011 RepID=A0ABY6ZJD9_9BACL|nr:hypothetical protein [Alicyclobacillus fastidiosus]WAH43054.1 hypothetical protein NZD89_06500 [Alicyclobacillus fastidiosus]GMA65040.1 hypothetical protein GCM10025859_54800 [Alicyclobacillus fastidiosus]
MSYWIENMLNSKPIDWRSKADEFLGYVFDEKNQVMHRTDNGHVHFTAFIEGSGCELITYGGIIVGKLLRGEDVQELLPSLEDYYSENYGIYQNGVGDKKSEYWYLMHVNALAATITRLALMDNKNAVNRLRSSMDRLIQIAHQNNYSFNDQGYDFENAQPWTKLDAFRQPDTIGAYAYLMEFAYELFGEEAYQSEARAAMQNYTSFEVNPWYEIPSGAMACLAAAKLNDGGATFPLDKVVQFALDPEFGSLHEGTWGNAAIDGLMRGWRGHSREEASSMAYSFETFVLVPYLLPVARYDARFAKRIGRYLLHAAINARLFYGNFHSKEAQGRPDLSHLVPYEALHHERDGHSPYATGDFHGQKSVYGGAYTLWWGEIIRPTSDSYVLELDVTKTDFLTHNVKPTKMYYNPYQHDLDVTVHVGTRPVNVVTLGGVYLHKKVTGAVQLSLKADSVTFVQLEVCV